MYCPCGSMQNYRDCCGVYHDSDLKAPTALLLMKSRYSAYALSKIEYIKKTMRGPAIKGFNAKDALLWSQSIQWLGLEILDNFSDKHRNHVAYVEFVATFSSNGIMQTMRELSEFHCIKSTWYYVNGKRAAV